MTLRAKNTKAAAHEQDAAADRPSSDLDWFAASTRPAAGNPSFPLKLFHSATLSLDNFSQAIPAATSAGTYRDTEDAKSGTAESGAGHRPEVPRPDRLLEIISELAMDAKPVVKEARLKDLTQALTAVDGTLLNAASLLKDRTGSGLVKWRLHTHFNIRNFVPERIDVTPDGGGPNDERAVLERTLKADHCYIEDRGYAKFSLFNGLCPRRADRHVRWRKEFG
jgi:hypothetical protein